MKRITYILFFATLFCNYLYANSYSFRSSNDSFFILFPNFVTEVNCEKGGVLEIENINNSNSKALLVNMKNQKNISLVYGKTERLLFVKAKFNFKNERCNFLTEGGGIHQILFNIDKNNYKELIKTESSSDSSYLSEKYELSKNGHELEVIEKFKELLLIETSSISINGKTLKNDNLEFKLYNSGNIDNYTFLIFSISSLKELNQNSLILSSKFKNSIWGIYQDNTIYVNTLKKGVVYQLKILIPNENKKELNNIGTSLISLNKGEL